MLKIVGYNLVELLYDSPCSLVYRGIRIKDDKAVILKIVKGNPIDAKVFIHFRHEYHIAKLFFEYIELINVDNTLCIVMDDFGGESINNIINRKNIAPKQFIEMAISIVNSLDRIHECQVIHKDLNPSNIVWNQETGQISIIDFGISTELTREKQEITNVNVLEGTLPYLSPEQTGRMNRSIDYRTDYYSLGVTLYEILTGGRPFVTTDPMGMVHSHIAIEPAPIKVEEIGDWKTKTEKSILEILSEIILKLMSKQAEFRYQSLFGLKHDLNFCLQKLEEENEELISFEIATNDIAEKFQIPQKIYGRDREIEVLIKAFDRVTKGAKEFLLISGYSGVGKSTLVYETHKPIFERHGYFIQGKFDQFKRDIPYSAFASAISKWVNYILSESEDRIEQWKEKLLSKLGENAQVVIDLVPELELLLGEQKKLSKLGLDETRNRFTATIKSFIRALGNPKEPVVIFLDDLQWADTASLKLIELTMGDRELKGLLLIGAYRDNEIDEMHPLLETVENIKNENSRFEDAGVLHEINVITNLSLEPLKEKSVLQLISDTLVRKPEDIKEFTQLCFAKTQGNPFFLNQLLQSLFRASVINLNRDLGIWEWNHEKLASHTISENVIELMVERIRTLSKSSQDILKLAACAGNSFDLNVLSIINEKPKEETSKMLWESLKEGLISSENGYYELVGMIDLEDESPEIQYSSIYSFVHDRVQQAAYSLIEADEKEKVHLVIARLMLKKVLSLQNQENTPLVSDVITRNKEQVFDIVNHFNKGINKITDPAEKEIVIRLNYQAGRKALKSNAYHLALSYFENGLKQLDVRSWKTSYQLTMGFHVSSIEAAYYNFQFELMGKRAEAALEQCKTLIEEVPIYEIIMKSLSVQEKLTEVLNKGFEILNKFKLNIPEHPKKMSILVEFLKTKWILRGKTTDDLYELPLMKDPEALCLCRILAVMVSSAYVVRADLSPILSLKLIQLSLKYGNYPNAQIYPFYGLMYLLIMNDLDSCYNYGELGLRLSEKEEFKESKTQNILMFYAFSHHWKKQLHESIPKFQEGYQAGVDNGDFEFACWCLHCPDYTAFYSGAELTELSKTMDSHREKMIQLQQNTILGIYTIVQQTVSNLIGENDNPRQLTGKYMNEIEVYEKSNDGTVNTTIATIFFWRSFLDYMFHDYESAVINSSKFEEYAEAHAGLSSIPVSYLISSLANLAIYKEVSDAQKSNIIKKVKKTQRKMKKLTLHSPTNNLHKWHMVEAELARVKKDSILAVKHYEQAVSLAKENQFLSEEALAYELYAKFNLEQKKNELGSHLMLKAHNIYSIWGAVAKTNFLKETYPEVFNNIWIKKDSINTYDNQVSQTNTQSGRISSSILDIETSLSIFQTISGEMRLELLIERIMKLVIQNAGAEKGYLILKNNGDWTIQASVSVEEANGLMDKALILNHTGEHKTFENEDVPVSIINYVIRTKKAMILNDAATEGEFTNDNYVKSNSLKSIICMPLVNQGKMSGILYLENNLTAGAFTLNQIQLLNMFSSQAAISLENAKLYHRLETKVDERTRELKELSDKYQKLSITDQLTNVFNRRKIDEVLRTEFDRAVQTNTELSIILFDIDKFKNVNDSYGHLTGDKVLIHLSDLVRTETKKKDVFGRWGGEEFILICPNTTTEKALILAERLRVIIAETRFDEVDSITCSFGISTTKGSNTIDECLNEVDFALYKAKENGRNRVEIYKRS